MRKRKARGGAGGSFPRSLAACASDQSRNRGTRTKLHPPPPTHPIHNRTQTREARKQIMQSVARLVARSARSSAEHNCSRRKLASTARCGGGGGTKEEILKVPQSSAATMAEPAAGDAATRSRTASQVATGIAQGERFFVGYCVVVYGSLLGLVLRRFRRA